MRSRVLGLRFRVLGLGFRLVLGECEVKVASLKKGFRRVFRQTYQESEFCKLTMAFTRVLYGLLKRSCKGFGVYAFCLGFGCRTSGCACEVQRISFSLVYGYCDRASRIDTT